MIHIQPALPSDAPMIAPLIMEAMNLECCQWFAGPHHTIDEFRLLMTRLISLPSSQYSYLNTLVAVDTSQADQRVIAGICVSYDGKDLHTLRQAFVSDALATFGIDYSGIPDETSAGELYIDSLCVSNHYRHQGIASQLLKATIEKGKALHLPTGLLVDKGNPQAEQLYLRLGFVYVDDNEWGGHGMKHLQHPL